MRGKILWSNPKEGVDNSEEKKEVSYMGDEEGGKMVPVIPPPTSSKIWIVLSVVSLLVIVLMLVVVVSIFWEVPGRVEEQEQEVERLENLIKKQQAVIDSLMGEKTEMSGEQSPDICSLPALPGPCTTASMQRWHYHSQAGTCRQFTYGGCQGNRNNFHTAMECEAACGHQHKKSLAGQECLEPPVSGPCRGQHLRYYYDSATDSCNQFSYGGCAGNGNNFLTAEKCGDSCINITHSQLSSGHSQLVSQPSANKKSKMLPEKPISVCSLPKDKGPCSDPQTRWYYNPGTGVCQIFEWGGCQGNNNNFLSHAKCEARCGLGRVAEQRQGRENCLKKKDQGTCRGIFERFYYNVETETCEEFVFGGCGGNENNFVTKEKCNAYCLGEEYILDNTDDEIVNTDNVDEICSSPSDPGSCREYVDHYYYNIVSEECELFTYSGCGGNNNNFITKEACTQFCISK